MNHRACSAIPSEPPHAHERCADAVMVLAQARAACLALGVTPQELARLFLDEAMLAFLIEGLDDASIRDQLDAAVTARATPWLGRLRQKSGMCDCVAEVHFDAACEARAAASGR